MCLISSRLINASAPRDLFPPPQLEGPPQGRATNYHKLFPTIYKNKLANTTTVCVCASFLDDIWSIKKGPSGHQSEPRTFSDVPPFFLRDHKKLFKVPVWNCVNSWGTHKYTHTHTYKSRRIALLAGKLIYDLLIVCATSKYCIFVQVHI